MRDYPKNVKLTKTKTSPSKSDHSDTGQYNQFQCNGNRNEMEMNYFLPDYALACRLHRVSPILSATAENMLPVF